jgi:hypothetical protein
MSELVWLTLAAMAVFLIVLVPANYLVSLLWARDPSYRDPAYRIHIQGQGQISMDCFVVRSTTGGSIQSSPSSQQTARTTGNGFDQLAAA